MSDPTKGDDARKPNDSGTPKSGSVPHPSSAPPPGSVQNSDLDEVSELQSIKGIPFPAGVAFRQLVVTGPPGTGKTTLVTALGGWPEEGFLDLTQRNWWRSRALTFRPRQLHLLLPFSGFRRALSTFEDEWLDQDPAPVLDLDRIQIPPLGSRRDPSKSRRKYVFEFLLPPAQKVFEARQRRSDRQSHEIDVEISLHQIKAQLEVHRAVAWFFHHAGLIVYVRDEFGGAPKVFSQASATSIVESRTRGRAASRRSPFHSYIKQIISPRGYRVLDRYERVHLVGKKVLIPLRILPVELTLGPQKLRIEREEPLEPEHPLAGGVRVLDPSRYFDGISPFVRILPDEIIRLPDQHSITPDLPEDVPARVEIANEGDWVTVVDLDSPTGTTLVALDEPEEIERLANDRAARIERLRKILDGIPPSMPPVKAGVRYEAALKQLEEGRFRPENSQGQPGAVVELPESLTPVIIGDLHAEVDNLLTILSAGRFLDALEDGTGALVILGDAVHPENEDELLEMDSSVLMMDAIVTLMLAFPGQVFYLRGNHDTFSANMTKGGVSQGRAWQAKIEEERGEEGVAAVQAVYDHLPYIIMGPGFIACHAGPPQGAVTRAGLIDLDSGSWLAHQLTWSRVFTARNAGGYTKRDVRALVKALGSPKPTILVVSHNPRVGSSVQINHGGIKRHYMVYSAGRESVSVITRVNGVMVPLTFPTRRVLDKLEPRI